jgi:hypothetical protein
LTREEDLNYIDSFVCQRLTADENNKLLIENFKPADECFSRLDCYLKKDAWKDDLEGETRVYLIKDSNNNIAFYFSIKCGLLISKNEITALNKEELNIVDAFRDAIKAGNDEDIEIYLNSGLYEYTRMESLLKIARTKIDREKSADRIGDHDTAVRVDNCYSAIEIKEFARNGAFEYPDLKISFGMGIFWRKILPIILDVREKVGCGYVYAFAADQSDEQRTLVNYYKSQFRLTEFTDKRVLKPYYDDDCFPLFQSVTYLAKNADSIWEEYYE